MKPIETLHSFGQSLWYDNIQRKQLENGELATLIRNGDIRGITSNPSIFHNAIAKSNDYDRALKPMAWAGLSAEAIFNQLAIQDIRAAADLFMPLYRQTKGADGYVSLEVNPFLANDTQETFAEAKKLWQRVDRPNLMIKIPATLAGIPAVEQAIAEGINVNVTLIFSLTRYAQVMEAYLSGLEKRAAAGLSIDHIASVASFFISRVDTKVDAQLRALITNGMQSEEKISPLIGQTAIANAKLAYADFQKVFGGSRFAALKEKGARVQRPLWASTSTKDPAYRDVLYIEELIGPDSVNTVPPQTLDAFRDHGKAAVTLIRNVAQAEQQMVSLKAVGISMEQVTDALETEGVKAFADAFSALLRAVEERRAGFYAQTGSLAKPLADRILKLDYERIVDRIYENDPSVWTTDAAGQAEIRKRLGWLSSPEKGLPLVEEITRFAEEIRNEGFTHVLLLGMGGSSLAPEVMRLIFGHKENENGEPTWPDLAILDSTDPRQVKAAAMRSPIDKTLYIVSSKSGSTAEIAAFVDYFWTRTKTRLGRHAGKHFIAITDPGTSLEQLAKERKFRKIFAGDPNVGGRFSVLTPFGLVPAALMGIDLKLFLTNAVLAANDTRYALSASCSTAVVLGAAMGQAALQGRDKLTLLADPELTPMGAWLEQLIAESSGKMSKGIVPIDGEMIDGNRTYGADRIFVYMRRSGRYDQTVAGLLRQGCPVFILENKDFYQLGADFYRWEMATAVACSIMNVNAFDQPDVQDNKLRTLAKIDQYKGNGSFDEGQPQWRKDEISVFGIPLVGIEKKASIADVVELFLKQAKTGDYIALNAYLPRNKRTLDALSRLRTIVQSHTGLATTLGFGPRFLHSTGQLHKGGADNGLFIQITDDPSLDTPIPGQGMSFGSLERAQALGDLEALLARGRRAIRIHLGSMDIQDLEF
ncbi:MAG TPA: bifunctional transaldolase/phosoglucose isomerase [Anaerolineaceae bacterium]|nr:bifunctional transaldolase/phosoglucose isomerase [Anaerolineaceae bacterium]HPN53579.1 bifunctional transaldolase/phosoglucose isomerase [Anaerolineaceae bacterium]